jgi:uncharacterized protein YybS (DUF2232 family)
MDEVQYLPCDFCHREMTFEEYSQHHCNGLSGRNPLQERLKQAKWKLPKNKGALKASGHALDATEVRRRQVIKSVVRMMPIFILILLVVIAKVYG